MANDLQSRKDSRLSAKSSKPKANLKDFMQPWAKLCAAYPAYGQTRPTLMAYYEHLSRFEVDKIMRAVNAVIERSTFFPSIAEIIDAINAQAVSSGQKLLDALRPTKEEAQNAIKQLQAHIAESEKLDRERREKRLRERKAFLKKQAALINAAEKEF